MPSINVLIAVTNAEKNIFCTFTFPKNKRCLVNGELVIDGQLDTAQLARLHALKKKLARLHCALQPRGAPVARGRKREAAPARPARRPSSAPGPTTPRDSERSAVRRPMAMGYLHKRASSQHCGWNGPAVLLTTWGTSYFVLENGHSVLAHPSASLGWQAS